MQKHVALELVHNGMSDTVRLTYSVTEHTFIAILPASGILSSVQDEQLKLTVDMVGHIVCEPDGTIRLDLW